MHSNAPPEVVASFEQALALGAFRCQLQDYKKRSIRSLMLTGEFIAYASPDSTYAVTKSLIDQARKSILIGIYDFTAGYMKELLLKAVQRGVKVALMLDLDGRTGETPLFEQLKMFGVECVPAPSCNSERARYFSVSHEKVIVIDDAWTLVQSGNYSPGSIPQNESDGGSAQFLPGNRDMGVAVRSSTLARFFSGILRSDMQLELSAPTPLAARSELASAAPIELLEAAPPRQPVRLFSSQRFSPPQAVRVTPVLSPDNYMDVIPRLLASATSSVEIEQQYIRARQPRVQTLLSSLRSAILKNSGLEVRIVLAAPIGDSKAMSEDLLVMRKEFGLKLGAHIRILNPRHFVHCHNKLIIVDRQKVLISSQNWSDSAITTNREAGVLLDFPELAAYYRRLFQEDWNTGLKRLKPKPLPKLAPLALASGKAVQVNPGDYLEV